MMLNDVRVKTSDKQKKDTDQLKPHINELIHELKGILILNILVNTPNSQQQKFSADSLINNCYRLPILNV